MVPKCMHGQNADAFPGVMARNKPCHEYGKFVHSTFYPYIIHPHSLFRLYWEIFYILFYLFQLLFFFMIWYFSRHNSILYQVFLILITSVNLVDLVLSFFTGYVENNTEIEVMEPERITRRYMMTTLIFDIPGSFPYELLSFFFFHKCVSHRGTDLVEPCQYIMYAHVFGIFFRIVKTVKYIRNVTKMMFWNPIVCGIVCLSYIFIVIINFNLAYLTLSSTLQGNPIGPVWQDFVMLTAFIEEFMYILFYDREGIFLFPRIEFLLFTSFFEAVVSAYVIKYIRFRMRTTERFYNLESSVRTLARKRRLPISVKQKIFLYFKVFIQSKHYKEDDIFYYFPDAFKADIYSHFSLSLLKKFQPFEGLPKYILGQLAEALKYQLHLPNELVMMKGEETISMYFIQSGRVALYSGDNIEIYHFDDGDYFNARHFMEGEVSRKQYAISVEVAEIHRLDLIDFQRIMASYPQWLESIREKFFREVLENPPLIE